MALPTLSEFASRNPSDDPLDTYKRYSDFTKTELLKAGEWDDDLVNSIDANLMQKAMVEGIDLGPDPDATFRARASEDAKLRELRQLESEAYDRKDEVATNTLHEYAGMFSPMVKQTYTDPVAYNTRLQQLEEAAKPYLTDTEAINRARRMAVRNGETPVAVVKRGDTEDIELSPELLNYVGDDQGLGMLLDNHPEVPRSLIPAIRLKLSVPEGYKAPYAAFERQTDFFNAVEKDWSNYVNDAANALSKGDIASMDGIVNSALFGIGNALGRDFSEAEQRNYLLDMVKLRANPDIGENPLMELSTGQVVAPLNLAFDKQKFDAAVDSASIPEVQKTRLREERVAQLNTAAPSIFGVIAGYDPDFVPFKEKMVREGKSNAEILDTWNANPERKTANDVYLSQAGAGVKDAIVGIPLSIAALAGSDTAKNIMIDHMKEDGARRAYSQLMGRNTGIGYDLLSVAPQLGADIAIAVATGGLGAETMATRTTAKAALKGSLKGVFGTEAKSLASAYLRNIAGDVTADQVYKLAARDMAAYLAPKVTNAAFLGTAFTRSAGSAYASISSALEAKGVPPDQVRSAALGHALIAGSITAAITAGMSFMGKAGMESVFDDLSKPQLNRVFNKVKSEWDNLSPAVKEGIDMTSAEKMLASVMTKSVRPFFATATKRFREEAIEEGIDQFSQYVNEKLATGDRVNLAEAAREAGYAALLGGVMGGGIPAIRDTYTGVTGKEAPQILQDAARTRLFNDTAAKLDATSPRTAALMRALANQAPATRSVPEAVPPAGAVPAPSGQAVAGAEAESVSQPEQVEYFNFVMGEPEPETPAAPQPETPAAPQPKTREQLDAELQEIVSRYKARKGPAIQLEPIPLQNPDRIYLEQLPLRNPDRILLEPIDLGDTVLYGRGLSAEGGRILMERIRLTKQRGPQVQTTPDSVKAPTPAITRDSGPVPPAKEKQPVAKAKPSRAGTRSGLVASADQSTVTPTTREAQSQVPQAGAPAALEGQPTQPSATGGPEEGAAQRSGEGAEVAPTTESLGLQYTESVGRLGGWKGTASEFVDKYGSGNPQQIEDAAAYTILRNQELGDGAVSPVVVKRAKEVRKELRKRGYKITDPTAQATAPTTGNTVEEIDITDALAEPPTPVEVAATAAAPEIALREDPDTLTQAKEFLQSRGVNTDGLSETDAAKLIEEEFTPRKRPEGVAKPGQIRAELERHNFSQGLTPFLQSVARTGETRYREMAKLLLGYPELLANTPVTLVDMPNSDYAGAMIPSTGQIVVNEAGLGPRGAVDTVIHELLHAATLRSLYSPTESQRKFIARLDRLRETVSRRASEAGIKGMEYALGSNDEFITHWFTSPRFQQQVGKLTLKGERNLIQVIRDTIKSLLTGKPVSQIDRRINELMDEMLTFTKDALDTTWGTSRMDQLMSQPEEFRDLSRMEELQAKGELTPAQEAELRGLEMKQQPTEAGVATDAEYLDAVQRGDMETAQRMVDAAARAAGYNRKGVRFGFYVNGVPMPPAIGDQNFGPGYYVAEDADPSIASGSVSVSPEPNARTLQDAGLKAEDVEFRRDVVFVKAQKPLQGGLPEGERSMLNAEAAYQSAINDAYSSLGKYGFLFPKDISEARGVPLLDSSIRSGQDFANYQRTLAKLIRDGALPYDSIRGMTGRKGMSSELVVQNASQIKSADPVTYDSSGQVIPLSQRFNPATPDIRFQPAEFDETLRRADEAGMADLPASEDTQHLTDTLTSIANGQADARVPDYRVNPERKSQLITYLKGVVRHLAAAPFDPETATTLDRAARFLAKAKDNFITRPLAPPLDLDEVGPRFQMAESAEPFYSVLTNVIDAKVQGRSASPEQLKALIDNPSNGVKAEEIKWSGVKNHIDQLAAENGGKVPKDALLNWLSDEGAVRFEEVTMGTPTIRDALRQVSATEWRLRNDPEAVITSEEGQFQAQFAGNYGEWKPTLEGAYADLIEIVESAGGESISETIGGNRYAQYVLPGGENYREVVLAMPVISQRDQNALLRRKFEQTLEADEVAEYHGMLESDYLEMPKDRQFTLWKEAFGDVMLEIDELYESPDRNDTYTSSHFPDVPNYVAHMRLNERTDADGKPGLFIEELQSDRHQEGRKKGYQDNTSRETAEKLGNRIASDVGASDTQMANYLNAPMVERIKSHPLFESWINARLATKRLDSIPDAPYRTTWPLALFKRALRDAVAGGKTWIGWTVGETQKDRFDLSKQVDSIIIPYIDPERRNVSVYLKEDHGDYFALSVTNDGTVTSYDGRKPELNGKSLDDVIGKDMADKIMSATEETEFRGEGLKVGGSGMIGFYDNMLPKEIGKYVERLGKGKVTQDTVVTEKARSGGLVTLTPGQSTARVAKTTPIWRIDITPEMAKSVSTQGQPLFQPSESADPENLTNYLHTWDGYKFSDLSGEQPKSGIMGTLERVFTQENDMRLPWRVAKKIRDFTMSAVAKQGAAASRALSKQFNAALKAGADADKLTQTIGEALGTTAPMLTEEEALRIHDLTDQRLIAAREDLDTKVAAAEARAKKDGRPKKELTAEVEQLEAEHAATVQQIMSDDQAERIKSELEFAKEARRVQDLAMQALTESHPDLAKSVGDMRALLNAFQDEVSSRMGHRPDLQMKIDRSRGIYLVRSYRLHQDPSLGQRILNDPEYQELRDRTISFFEKKFADQWVAKVKDAASKTPQQINAEAGEARLTGMAEQLRKLAAYAEYPEHDLREVARHEVAEQARHAFEDFIIGRTNLRAEVPGLESIKVDAARFMRKGNVPKEIRDALLENTDPLFNATHTFNALANIVVQHDMLTRFREAGMSQGWLTDAEGKATFPDRYKGWEPVVTANEGSAAWSAMAGIYAAPEDIEAFHSAFKSGSKRSDTTAARLLGTLNKKLTGFAGLSLGIVTQGNPAYYTRNVVNGLFLMAANGVNPIGMAKGLRDLPRIRQMEAGTFDFNDQFALRNVALGLVQGGTVAAEIESLMQQYQSDPVGAVDKVHDFLAERMPKAAAALTKGREVQARALKELGDLAAMSEGFAAHAVMDNNVKVLTEAKFGTPEEIFREAARRTLRTTPARSEAPQAITAFTQNGLSALIAPFARFKADMVRITANIFADAYADMKSDNPVLKAHGRKTMASASMVVVGITSILPMIAAAIAGIGEDEDRAIRAALPDYAKNSSFIYWRDPKNPKQFLTFDLTFLNSYSFLADPFTQGFTAIARGRFSELPEIVARTFGQEVFGENVVAGAIMDVKRNIDESTKRPIYLESDTFGDKTYKSLAHVINSAYLPAAVKKAVQFEESFSRTSKSGENFWYTPQGVLIGTIAPFKPRVNNVDDLNYRVMAKFRNAKSQLWQNTAPLKSPAALSPDKARDIVDKQVEATRRLASEGWELIQGFRKLGMTDREIMQNMVDSGSSERSAKLLMQGYAMRPVLDKESLQKIYALSPERYKAIVDQQNKHAVYLKVSP